MALRGSWEYLRVMAPRRYEPATRDEKALSAWLDGGSGLPGSPGEFAYIAFFWTQGPVVNLPIGVQVLQGTCL